MFSYWKNRNLPNLLIIRYEDLISDLRGQIKLLASFLEKQFTEAQIDKLVDHLSFHTMKKNPAVNGEFVVNIKRKNNEIVEDGHFMRAGIVGKHKTEMTSQMIETFDRWIQENIQGTGWKV